MTNTDVIGVAVAGLGFGYKVHIPALLSNPKFSLKGLWHPDINKVKKQAEDLKLKAYSDWSLLLADKSIQAIVIATPPEPRFELAIKALKAGKHLLLEKPVGLNCEQISQLQKISVINRLIVAVDFEYRAVPHFIQAKRVLETNKIGEPWLVKFDWLMSSRSDINRPWNWYSDINKGGGVIGALGTHAFDILHWLIGPTFSVSSIMNTAIKERTELNNGNLKKVTSEDICLTNNELTSNENSKIIPTQIALSAVSRNGRGFAIEIYGSKGKLLLASENQKDYVHGFGLWVTDSSNNLKSVTPDIDIQFTKTWEDGRIAPVQKIQATWADAIQKGIPVIPGLSEAYNSQKVCDLARKSYISSNKVLFDSQI